MHVLIYLFIRAETVVRGCSVKKGFLKNLTKFVVKHLSWSLQALRLATLLKRDSKPAALLKRDSNTGVSLRI